jgi:DNA-binding NarL/FixJ family response regulator
MTIRVLLADDQEMVRSGFRLLLAREADLEVVGEAADGLEAVALTARRRPDVVLMDIRMPRLDGLEATRRILAGGPAARILILTTFDDDQYVFEALHAGASGFILKDAPAADMLDAIRVIARGDALLAPSVTRRVIAEFARRERDPRARTRLTKLTERELEVLRLLARGMSNAEIASALVISGATVKTHVARIIQKLGVRDRVQAVVSAYESGLMDTDFTAR